MTVDQHLLAIRQSHRAWRTFLAAHPNISVAELPLKLKGHEGFSAAFGAAQLSAYAISERKFPNLALAEGIIFPPKISLEQASSWQTAQYKARLFDGQKAADLTGGMGIDSMALAQRFSSVDYAEPDPALAATFAHNAQTLGLGHLRIHQTDAARFLASAASDYDLIYLDPSRRHEAKGRVFRLEDLQPNPLPLLPALLKKARVVLLKLSPMLDLAEVKAALRPLSAIWVLALKNECKELLVALEPANQPPKMHCVDINGEEEAIFSISEGEAGRPAMANQLQRWIYDPNTAIRKAQLWDAVGERFGLAKLHPNTALFTADAWHGDFPGRVFRLVEVLKPSRKAIRQAWPSQSGLILTRNYPASVAELRKQWALADGGEDYLIATTLWDGSRKALHCRREK